MTTHIEQAQRLVNERDELEHRASTLGAKALRHPKSSQKRIAGLRECERIAERIAAIDRELDELTNPERT